MDRVEIPAKPGRLIRAVASIGYDTEVALCDLVDNSIDAGATTVRVYLAERSREEEGQADTIRSYSIADDGSGMNLQTLKDAFILGAEKQYAPGSLGKFGIGLKSAGLSLGHTLRILTKDRSGALLVAILRMEEVLKSEKYAIDIGEATGTHIDEWNGLAPAPAKSGTVLVIEDLTESQPNFARFEDYLARYCGIVYHLLLTDPVHPLKSMKVNNIDVVPFDPLFMEEARKGGALQPETAVTWDGRTVHLLAEDETINLGDTAQCSVAMTHLVHPPTFAEEQEKVRDQYGIGQDPHTRRPRHGFYIYRNRRVIVMAERFRGIVASQIQSWAFRGRLMFDQSADEILDLDVKKRHCRLPREAENHLKEMVATRQALSADAWREAGRRHTKQLEASKEQLANKGIAESPVEKLTYSPGLDVGTPEEAKKKEAAQESIATDTLASVQDESLTKEVVERKAESDEAIVLATGLKGNAMWLPYPAVKLGKAQVLVNKAHSWIAEAYAAAETDARLTIVLHQIFMILGRAELEARSVPWKGISEDIVAKILDGFRRRVSMVGEDLSESLAASLSRLTEKEPGEGE